MLSTSLRIYSHLVDHYPIRNQVSLGEDSCNLILWASLHQEFEENPGNDVGKVEQNSKNFFSYFAVNRRLLTQRKLLDFNLFQVVHVI